MAGERLMWAALARSLEDADNLGEQVSPPGRQLAERGHRGVMLGAGQVPPSRMVLGFAEQFSDQEPVRCALAHSFG